MESLQSLIYFQFLDFTRENYSKNQNIIQKVKAKHHSLDISRDKAGINIKKFEIQKRRISTIHKQFLENLAVNQF